MSILDFAKSLLIYVVSYIIVVVLWFIGVTSLILVADLFFDSAGTKFSEFLLSDTKIYYSYGFVCAFLQLYFAQIIAKKLSSSNERKSNR